MARSILCSFMFLLFLALALAAPSTVHSLHNFSADLNSRTLSPTCSRRQILKIAKCACYLGTHGVTLSDVVHQACQKAFGDDYASPSHGLCKSCKIFEKEAGTTEAKAEMKVLYKAASKCLSSMTAKTSYRSFSMMARTAGKGVLRHRTARLPWIPLILVALLLTGDTPR